MFFYNNKSTRSSHKLRYEYCLRYEGLDMNIVLDEGVKTRSAAIGELI